ncbi:uncharacterized protein ZK643.6-like [Haliotis rufescens]|uniref:uncharacterized protein ZK643.6-like n=1 Tax=Haliotis rufescens TaxID=6454 RepID=UPI00201F79BF|nr:uncharacterized protein ZK643.6-like [Haliotis rufescens]
MTKLVILLSLLASVSGLIVKRQTCTDKIQNCVSYGKDVCSTYTQWAQANCCGFCAGSSQTSPSSQQCVDKLPNCADLGGDLCSTYVEFAQINCQKTCDLCQTTSALGGSCADKLNNCPAYGKTVCGGQYSDWAKENCPQYCNLCPNGAITGSTQVCVFKGKTYNEGDSWADGCDKNCTCVSAQIGKYLCQSVCPNYKNLPAGCQMVKQPGACCAKPDCPSLSNVCVYKGQSYQQGQTWVDGCDYRCTCTDGKTGHYQCKSRCVNWNLLPSCHLDNPAPGKCCPTPNCPANVKINYPAGYVPE